MCRHATRFLLIFVAGIFSLAAKAAGLQDLPVSQLETRLRVIDSTLTKLAPYNIGNSVGSIGFRSLPHDTEDDLEWIEIELGEPSPIDEIVLVPAICRDATSAFQADGFPKSFRVLAGTDEDRKGKVIAQYNREDGLLPRIAPLVIACDIPRASWIRIEAQTLSQRAFDKKYVLQFSEILAFAGGKDVALQKPVTSSSNGPAFGWGLPYLVDGFLPYLMASPREQQSIAFVSPPNIRNPALTVDLGVSQPLSRIHLHAVDQSDTAPQAWAGDFGIPKLLRVEGANKPDFSDATTLIELHHEVVYDVGPIMMWSFPETNCRFVRLKTVVAGPASPYGPTRCALGLAEIELFSGDQNVALHKNVTANFEYYDYGLRKLANLTDGLNVYGEILPIRVWLEQLATRHELERERPLLAAEISKRYARQKTMFERLIWFTGLLAAGIVIIVMIDRVAKRRAIDQTRNRIAADLHDELGADMHAIGLLSDLAKSSKEAPEVLDDLHERIRSLTERAGQAMRHCTNMLEAKGLFGDLVGDMRRTAGRILTDLQHRFDIEGEESLPKLGARRRIDLIFFYQECLINIIRHSGATQVKTQLTVAKGKIRLTVCDNGRGLQGKVPFSLKRRPKLLGASLHTSDSGGARISLDMRIRRFAFLR